MQNMLRNLLYYWNTFNLNKALKYDNEEKFTKWSISLGPNLKRYQPTTNALQCDMHKHCSYLWNTGERL